MSISILQHTQGIIGYKFLRSEYSPRTYTAYICKKPDKQRCASCNSANVTATAVGKREIKALPFGTKKAIINVKMHRLRCHDCKAYRMETIQFTSSPESRISKSFERTLLELRQHMSIKAAADYFGVAWSTVKNIEKRHLTKKFKRIDINDVKDIELPIARCQTYVTSNKKNDNYYVNI